MLTTPGAEEKPSWPLPVGTRILSFDRRPKPVDSVMVAVRATEGLLVQEGVFSCSASTTCSERERSIVSDQKEYNSDFGPRTQHNHCCWGMNRRSEATRGTSDWTSLCARCRATTRVSMCATLATSSTPCFTFLSSRAMETPCCIVHTSDSGQHVADFSPAKNRFAARTRSSSSLQISRVSGSISNFATGHSFRIRAGPAGDTAHANWLIGVRGEIPREVRSGYHTRELRFACRSFGR
jgi:hypothetical protein